MLRSMTGYGRVSRSIREKEIFMELKSVNSRYLDISFRLPHRWDQYEIDFSRILRDQLYRGKITVYAGITSTKDKGLTYLNRAQIRLYQRERRLLNPGRHTEIPYDEFALDNATGGYIIDPEHITDEIHALLKEAMKSLIESRLAEGTGIENEFTTHLAALDSIMSSVETNMQNMPNVLSDRMSQSLKKLGPDAIPLVEDRERVAKEIAAQLMKGDFSEELSRMKSHLASFATTMSGDAPHGRHLEFILQEMQRELNTMTSKCSVVDSVQLVLQSRVIIEKMREQVANIE
jgi:uncharacterized protein (TIGR00255 family)